MAFVIKRSVNKEKKSQETEKFCKSQLSNGKLNINHQMDGITVMLSKVTVKEPKEYGNTSDYHNSTYMSEQILLPYRPDFGREGRKIRIICNYFEMNIPYGLIYHYDVDIIPLVKSKVIPVNSKKYSCLNTKLNREIINELLTNFEFFRNCPAVFDGKKNLFTRNLLPINETIKFFVPFKNNEKNCNYQVVLKPVYKDKKCLPCIDLEPLRRIFYDKSVKISEEAIMALDTIMRHGPAQSQIPIGRCFFSSPTNNESLSLGGGREIWFGYHQSVRISQWKPMLNIDISATTFYKNQSVVKFAEEVLSLDIKRVKELKDSQIRILQKELKSLKIKVNHIHVQKKYKIYNVTRESAENIYFIWKQYNSLIRISVADYFRRQYKNLQYPNLPCLDVGNENASKYFPLEVCEIIHGQHCRKKLSEKQVAEMIKHTARPPVSKFTTILKTFKQTCADSERFIREFDISINHKPHQLDGRVLWPPSIMYDQYQEIRPYNGVWDIKGKHFYHPVSLEGWAFISLASTSMCKESDMENFAQMICESGKKLGMTINKPCYLKEYSLCEGSIETVFKKIINHCPIIQLIMVVIPNRGGGSLYSDVKDIAEIKMGLITQCIKDINLTGKKCNAQLICNLCQKINAKLGGINSTLSPIIKPEIFNKPVIIIGADCSHPSPHDKIRFSIAALVGSLDNYPSRYAATVNVQMNGKKNTVELIENIKDMMKDMLLAFYRNTRGQKPEKIIFYRDGLSEGEFVKAVTKELKLIRNACIEMCPSEEYKPPITFIVVGKRHHTRFIPENLENGVGKHKNIPPGTVIDTDIIHPTLFDFYICSHIGIQGTSRPTHYTVLWDDNNFCADELQKLSYYLCHTYVRCTRSISIPCPVMYAHLAAYRAKQHLMSKCEESSSNSDSASSSDLNGDQILLESSFKYAVQVDRKIRNTMYFV